jgi:hypothetical protein
MFVVHHVMAKDDKGELAKNLVFQRDPIVSTMDVAYRLPLTE